MTSSDLLVKLQLRNLEHVIDVILHHLGPVSLKCLALCSSEHYQLVLANRLASRRTRLWRRWINGRPTVSTLLDNEGSVVTSLAVSGNLAAYCLQDFEDSSSSIRMMDVEAMKEVGRIHVADYPVTLHSLRCSEEVVVFITSPQIAKNLLNVHWRKTKASVSQSASSRLTSLGLEGDLLVTGSESGLVSLVSLAYPGLLSPLHQVRHATEAVLDLALQQGQVVSLSGDSRLRVWTVGSDKCISDLSLGKEKLSRMAVRWPLCIISGLDTVLVWDLERRQQLQRLETGGVVSITRDLLLVGDIKGRLSIWSLQDLVDGHRPEEKRTGRRVECLGPENVISGVSCLSPGKILVTGWNGKCCLLSF